MTILCALLALLVANLVIENLVITITLLYSYSFKTHLNTQKHTNTPTQIGPYFIYFLEGT